jgi:hypothetical protein
MESGCSLGRSGMILLASYSFAVAITAVLQKEMPHTTKPLASLQLSFSYCF